MAQVRFEELWLLEIVVGSHPPYHGWIPFRNLPDDVQDDPDKMGNHADINFYSHHMPDEQLLDELYHLLTTGEIIGAVVRSGWPPDSLFVPSRAEIQDAFNWDNYSWLSYTLTEKGFARWEDYAKPNWDKFRCKGGCGSEDETHYATAANPHVAEYWFKWATYGRNVDFSRASYEEISPWQVFPFKTLPRGVKARLPIIAMNNYEQESYDDILREIEPWYQRSVADWKTEAV